MDYAVLIVLEKVQDDAVKFFQALLRAAGINHIRAGILRDRVNIGANFYLRPHGKNMSAVEAQADVQGGASAFASSNRNNMLSGNG